MCGIAGIYRLGDRLPSETERSEDRDLVSRMLRAIEYRGPDDLGLHSAGRVTLGVRRLAILDVPGGHQPLSDASGRVWAIQNGEIYNFPELRRDLATRHALRTHTDTEVLPHLWLERGAECLRALRGMFALAIFDSASETLLLARDPMGVKPLYVASDGTRLRFASELKALLCDPALPRDLDPDALARFLVLGFVSGAATPFRAIRKLRPGTRMVVTPRGETTERWWHWPRFFADPRTRSLPFETIADEVGERISDSARSMLLSDRPLGILLSGGVDSSLLVAMLPEDLRRETHTFTIGFDAAGHYDERISAREVAAHLGTRHQELVVPLDLARELPAIAAFLDEPCADPAAVPAHLVARAAGRHVTVLLSGTGGDEIFGGYRRHRLPALLRRARWIPRSVALAGARFLATRSQNRRTVSAENLVMMRKLLEARGRDSFFESYLSAFEPAARQDWDEAVAVLADRGQVAQAMWRELVCEIGDPPVSEEAVAFAADHLFYLPDDLLLKEDRMTMGASVESRVPYLDAGLVEFAAGLPLGSRFAHAEGKAVLRSLARRHLPARTAEGRKHGFAVPVEDWLRGPLAPLVGDRLAGSGSGVFRMPVLRRWLDEHRRGRDHSGALWAAFMFELWWDRVGGASPEALAAAGAPAT